jgi:hypothetical protein
MTQSTNNTSPDKSQKEPTYGSKEWEDLRNRRNAELADLEVERIVRASNLHADKLAAQNKAGKS